MKVAISYDNGEVFQHFGHSKNFKIYSITDKKILKTDIIAITEGGHSAVAKTLMENGVDVVICGNIGDGAKTALYEYNILIYGGVTGMADKVINDYLEDNLQYDPNVVCNHTHEDGEDSCSCGSDSSCHGTHSCDDHHCGCGGCNH